jgi:geranylgeranyl reductase family protein
MVKHAFDLAIVGAGPAGCRLACRMAAAGARVAIVDGSHPREKPCGGGVTGRALDLVRDALDRAGTPRVDVRNASMAHGTTRAEVTLPPRADDTPFLAVASRRDFDGALYAAALRAGAEPVAARVTAIASETTGWALTTTDRAIRAGWLIGADGPGSFVRRTVARPFARADLSIATGFFVHGSSGREITIAFENAPPGYLWVFPRTDHLAVGVCAQADRSTPAMLLPCAEKWIAGHVRGPMRLDRYSWPIPSLRVSTIEREQPSGARWLLLGDAGGMVDPITREGIFFALLSADFAADSLLAGNDAAARYASLVRASIYSELLRAARFKAAFFSPRFISLLIRALQTSDRIRDVMADLIGGQQPYRGLRRRLLRTFEWGLMREVVLGNRL